MLRWVEASECWWTDVHVAEAQRHWVEDRPGLLARAYAFRASRSRAAFFFDGETAVGMAVFYDRAEAGAYVIGGFFIDERYQGCGYGTQAAEMVLEEMSRDGRYARVELRCTPDNQGAVRFWKKMGFCRYDAPRAQEGDDLTMRLHLTTEPGTLRLAEVGPHNWRTAVAVRAEQQRFVADRDRLLARAYGFLDDRSQARIIMDGETPVGMALWYDYPEGDAYSLIEFFIDGRYQGQGYGTRAAEMVLEEMRRDGRYDQVVICYFRENDAARRFWARLGFVHDPGEEEQQEPIMRRHLTNTTE